MNGSYPTIQHIPVEPLPTHDNVNQVDWKEMLRRAYRILIASGYVGYYYNNTAWDVVKPDPEPPGHARWQILKRTFESVPYWRMDPAPSLAAGGTCIAEPAVNWLCYLEGSKTRRKENTLTLNLTGLSGPASVDNGSSSRTRVNPRMRECGFGVRGNSRLRPMTLRLTVRRNGADHQWGEDPSM